MAQFVGRARISERWIISIPIELREEIGCRPKDNILFFKDGDVTIVKIEKSEDVKNKYESEYS